MGMKTRVVILLMLSLLMVDGAEAQRRKKEKPEPVERVKQSTEPRILMDFVLIDTERYMVVGTGQEKRIIEKPIADRGPEPLLRVDYLVEYPKSAIERQLEDTIRFFATVKKGLVTNVVLQGEADPVLMDAVRQAASKLKFDLSWHDANRPEFQYTQQIIFKLPDIILSRP
jgi:hypothetical protein